MKTIRLSQVALLGWALLMATATAFGQQEQSWLWKAGGVEVKLPSTWQEISPSLLQEKVSALGANNDHIYGAQTSKAGDDLAYPLYRLIWADYRSCGFRLKTSRDRGPCVDLSNGT